MNECELREIITNALDASDQDAKTDEKWDSLAHVSVLVALDTAFDGKIAKIEELHDAYSVNGIIGILRAKGLVA